MRKRVVFGAFLLVAGLAAETCNDMGSVVADLGASLASQPALAKPAEGLDPASFVDKGLRTEVLKAALTAQKTALDKGDTKSTLLTVIDYSMPSNQKRMFVIDTATGKLLFHLHTTHGKYSGTHQNATSFSNTDSSKQSNLGLLKTAETYYGKHGLSLKMDGLEKGYNDNARSRYIVIHGANYASPDYVRRTGRAGRSWGCPAVDPKVAKELIETIKGGSLVFGYFPDQGWLEKSSYLNPR